MDKNRRVFITSLLAMAAGGRAFSQPAAGGASLRKGYMLNTFPDRALPLLEKFRLLKEAGFQGVEPPHTENPDEVLRARDETGLEIASMSCGGASRLFAAALPPARAKAVDEIKTALRNAKRYGARSILVVPGVVDEKTTWQQNWDRCTECLRACLPVAEETGVTMAIENVWNFFLQSPLEFVQFIDQFRSDRVAAHFDVGNMMFLGWPEQWIDVLAHRVVCVHVKEFSRKMMAEGGKKAGFQVEYLEGDNNWPAIMKSLRQIKYAGWMIAEPAYRPRDVTTGARLNEISARMAKML